MLFNSLEFAIFFPTVFLLYYAIAHRYRWILLLIASYAFYMSWNPAYILLILGSTLVDYWMGAKMAAEPVQKKRRKYLYISLASNLGLLFFFKYFNFFRENVAVLTEAMGLSYALPVFNLLLPVGISFYTFQTLSYSIDIYYGKITPEKHLGRFALFVAFFPQLVAGPIERASNLLPQFRREVTFDYDRVSSGLRLALWGFVKKVVIADRLAMFVDVVYNSPGEHHGWTIVLATWMFAFQIFCDFSGYSDIAIGIARMLGFDLMKNFDRPYFATSLQDFWRRWHISLSTWFRDYVYIPLGGNRVVKWRWYYNLFLTFLISGLWHGAAWTFIIWGALHGGGIVLELMLRRGNQPTVMDGWQRIGKIIFIFGVVCLAWLFFRANSLSDAMLLLGNMTDFSTDQLSLNMILDSPYDLVVGIGSVLLLLGVHLFQEKHHAGIWIITQPVWVRWAIYLGLVLLILNFGEFNQQQFIYFQF